MTTLIMTKGLPASGKTTWARQWIEERPPGMVVRVNKDDLRAMMHSSRFDRKVTEPQIVAARDALVENALQNTNVSWVIVDDTGFGYKHEPRLRELAEKHGAEFQVKDFTDVPVKTCIERDLKRANSVGHKVINKMNMQFIQRKYQPPTRDPNLPDAIIVDIDGTLAHMTNRGPYDYSSKVLDDAWDPVIGEIVRAEFERGIHVLFVSGRKAQCRRDTISWLGSHGADWKGHRDVDQSLDTHLFMRRDGDNRPDTEVKEEIYEQHIAGKYNIKFVLDDRDQVVAMWRQRGLQVLQVADGEF